MVEKVQCEGKLLMLQPLTQCTSFIDFEGDKISQVHSAKSMLLMLITYRQQITSKALCQ